ncbi:MAG: DNA ligase D [Geminicoccaceae bacterium]|nr:DNA ligase D [Geminicoccaceae bacterium]
MAARRRKDNVVSLDRYRAKRDFSRTPEPDARARADLAEAEGRLFCVQQHAARRMHWDFRLQHQDALWSWAVPQGPSLDPKVRRLAVHVEDHPLDYARFEGVIPKGNYGAGRVIVWDIGEWVPMGDPEEGYHKGNLKFRLEGEKLRGGFALVRIKGDRQKGDNWLLIKERDLEVRPEGDGIVTVERPESVLSGRQVEEVRDDDDQVWLPGSGPAEPPAAPPKRLRPSALQGARKSSLGPLPGPQLASPVKEPPDDVGWLHEIKFDGYRTLARIENGAVRFVTRGGHDWTERYGELSKPFEGLACKTALIDGEIVVQGDDGVASFAALQDALAEGRTHDLTFYAFDLLHLDGCDLVDVPLIKRKQALHGLIGPALGGTSALQYSEHVEGQGRAFFAQAGAMGLEGVISKRAEAPYRFGRSRTWLKAKCVRSDEFVVVGYTLSAAAGGLGALLVAEAGEDGLRYAGRVGTGFKAAEGRRLLQRLELLARKTAPVKLPAEERRKDIRFVRPALLVEVQYMNRTADDILRHAAYKGLRPDKSDGVEGAGAEPPPTPRKKLIKDVDLANVWVTNPDRRMFSSDGPTKLELALYYARVGDLMLPELAARPVSLVRCPDGKLESCFFQRHAMPGMPGSVKVKALKEKQNEKRGDYLYVEDASGYLALPQFGAVELHVWGCRVDRPERPDRLVFDLDPDEGLPWQVTVEAALEVRDALDALDLPVFVKTTGGKGLHLVVPLARRQGWPEVERFAKAFAAGIAKQAPKRFTASMAKRDRRGRIFLDYLRNVRGSTFVAAYSLRARKTVTVSTPLSWKELESIDDPAELTYATVPDRLDAAGFVDPWAEIDRSAKALSKDMERRVGASG